MLCRKKLKLAVLVGANIAAYRKLKNWSQAELAEKLEITAVSLSRIERGLAAPRFQTLEKLCQIFECSASELFMSASEENCSHSVPVNTNTYSAQLAEQKKQEIAFMAEKILHLVKT